MTKDNFSNKNSNRPDPKTYEVGFGNPPEASKFKPGQSGNPKGGDKKITVPMAQAVVRSISVNAVKGNAKAQKHFTELLTQTELSNKKRQDERQKAADDLLQAVFEYKVSWEDELEKRRHLRIKAVDPLPHPDDITVDFEKYSIRIHGPQNRTQLADLDLWLNWKNNRESDLRTFLEERNDPENAPHLAHIDRDIIDTKLVLDRITAALARRASPDYIERRLTQLNPKTSELSVD
jgi:hypothetical protein